MDVQVRGLLRGCQLILLKVWKKREVRNAKKSRVPSRKANLFHRCSDFPPEVVLKFLTFFGTLKRAKD